MDGTVEGVTPEQAHWQPTGLANSIAATYAHLVLSEDMIVQGMFQGKQPLAASTWAGKAGVDSMPPQGSEGDADWSDWGRKVRVDLPALQKYAQAVYAASDAYLTSVKPEELERQIDTPLGKHSINFMLGAAIIGHVAGHSGEISAIKGLQGLKGYPF